MRSASAPVWECAVAPNSGSVTGLGFCRFFFWHCSDSGLWLPSCAQMSAQLYATGGALLFLGGTFARR